MEQKIYIYWEILGEMCVSEHFERNKFNDNNNDSACYDGDGIEPDRINEEGENIIHLFYPMLVIYIFMCSRQVLLFSFILVY